MTTETAIASRICDFASVLRAESWPDLDAEHAIQIAIRFVLVLKEVERLKAAREITESSMRRLH